MEALFLGDGEDLCAEAAARLVVRGQQERAGLVGCVEQRVLHVGGVLENALPIRPPVVGEDGWDESIEDIEGGEASCTASSGSR